MVIRLIKYEAIGMQYGQNVILKNINLTINDGELFVLVGPSGSGKTTLLRMINRLTAPTTGNVYLDEKRVKDYDLRELRLHMGYVLQDSSLFPNLTVGENIAIQLEQQGVNKKIDAIVQWSCLIKLACQLVTLSIGIPMSFRVVSSSVWRSLVQWPRSPSLS